MRFGKQKVLVCIISIILIMTVCPPIGTAALSLNPEAINNTITSLGHSLTSAAFTDSNDTVWSSVDMIAHEGYQYATSEKLIIEKPGTTIESGKIKFDYKPSSYTLIYIPAGDRADLQELAFNFSNPINMDGKECDYEVKFSDGTEESGTFTAELDRTLYRDGSEELPYVITKFDKFDRAANNRFTKHYELTQDMYFDTLPSLESFSGSLNGNGHTISFRSTKAPFAKKLTGSVRNITFDAGSQSHNYRILANEINGPAEIENVHITGGNMRVNESTGGVFARTASGDVTFKNCSNNSPITASTNSTNVGGFLGSIVGNGNVTFEKCINYGAVGWTYGANNNASLGGFIGAGSNFTIKECINYGYITGRAYAGGFIGAGGNSTIENSYNMGGAIAPTGYAGGFFGCAQLAAKDINIVIQDCYNGTQHTGATAAGGLIGFTTATATNSNIFINQSFSLPTHTNPDGELIGRSYASPGQVYIDLKNNLQLNQDISAIGIADSIYWKETKIQAEQLTSDVVFQQLSWDSDIWGWSPSLNRPVLYSNSEDDDIEAPGTPGPVDPGPGPNPGPGTDDGNLSMAVLLDVGETLRLRALTNDGSQFQGSWVSGDPLIATVDDFGVVTAIADGQTVIQAIDGENKVKFTIIVGDGAMGNRVDLINMVDTSYSQRWSSPNESFTISGNIATIVSTQMSGRTVQLAHTGWTLDNNHKYYAQGSFHSFDASYDKLGIQLGANTTGLISEYTSTNSGWTTVSTVYDGANVSGAAFRQIYTWNTATNLSGKVLQFRQPMLIDLTETFGAGNEPDAQWCYENIPYFSGTTTVLI